jgi:drug/metabolite transporter (DMT)-like permease
MTKIIRKFQLFFFKKKPPNPTELAGGLAVLGSALCFYFATLTIRWSKQHVSIDPAFFVFMRFLLGFFTVWLVLRIKKQKIISRRYDLLIGRAVMNCIAVYCFYKAVDLTTVAEANILNMTYPLFIVIITWFYLKDQRDMAAAGIVVVAFIGVYLILSPQIIGLNIHNLWGLASGFSASFAIILLNVSRKHHDSETILFYMFGIGTVIIYICYFDRIYLPNLTECYYLAMCSLFGFMGQYLLTAGFRYVTAVEGSVLSSTRILFAAILGPYMAADHPLTLSGWIGALLIFSTNVLLALRKQVK